MPGSSTAHKRHATYYQIFARNNRSEFALLDRELSQFRNAHRWLAEHNGPASKDLLRNLTRALAKYLRHRAYYHDLLAYCRDGLSTAEQLTGNPGWLLLLRHEAHFALGEWRKALTDVRAAIDASREIDPPTHARAVLALGRFQLNRGDYRPALRTLATAERLLLDLHDVGGVADARSEVAAYHLNRSNLDKALRLYEEVDQLRQSIDRTGPSDHSLLMLGVVHRAKGDYEQAVQLLSQLRARGRLQGNPAALATATHHLAWTRLEQGDFASARRLGEEAQALYRDFGDIRGASDSDELLGMVALAEGDTLGAESYIQRSREIRVQLGNQHGTASCLRRLAIVYLHRRDLVAAIRSLCQGLALYSRLGVLSLHRVIRIAKELWRWRTIRPASRRDTCNLP